MQNQNRIIEMKKQRNKKELEVPSHFFLRPSYFPEDSRKVAMASSLLCSASTICLWRALSES
jgi:hypothetical protein